MTSMLYMDQELVPPPGFVDRKACPHESAATQSVVVQDTADIQLPPEILVLLQLPNGLAVDQIFPSESPATHISDVWHDKERSVAAPAINLLVDHAGSEASTLFDSRMSLLLPKATQKFVDGHETAPSE